MSNEIMQNIYNGSFNSYKRFSRDIGSFVEEQSILVDGIFKHLLSFIDFANNYKKPLNPKEEEFLKIPITSDLHIAQNFLPNENYVYTAHVIFVKECIKIFEWIEHTQTEPFLNNLKEYLIPFKKNVEEVLTNVPHATLHLNWLRSWEDTFNEISIMITTVYANGLTWNGTETLPISLVSGDLPLVYRTADHQPLFKQITKGTTLLRTQLPSETAAKNLFTVINKVWTVEHIRDEHNDLVINEAKNDDNISISNCENCTVIVNSKVNQINITSCNKVTVLFRLVFSCMIMQDCNDCILNCFEDIPKITLDQCKTVRVYLNSASLNTKIHSTRSVGIILNFPFEDGSYKEFKLPEMIITSITPNHGLEHEIR